MVEIAGVWRWANTHTRYMMLSDHGVISVGSIADGNLNLTHSGEWTISDGLMEIRFLSIAGLCHNEAVGFYETRRSGGNLVMTLVTEECENRGGWLIGIDRTTRTWLPEEP